MMRSGARGRLLECGRDADPEGRGLDGEREVKDLVRPAQAGRGSARVSA
jgi:hypothetical protein